MVKPMHSDYILSFGFQEFIIVWKNAAKLIPYDINIWNINTNTLMWVFLFHQVPILWDTAY